VKFDSEHTSLFDDLRDQRLLMEERSEAGLEWNFRRFYGI
jgi:hypothetical protein